MQFDHGLFFGTQIRDDSLRKVYELDGLVLIFLTVQNCHLHSEAKTFGSVTAQKRNESHMNTGFSFVDAALTGTGPIYLGRAWGNYSRTVYSYTWMDNIVYPPGWSDFGFSDRQK